MKKIIFFSLLLGYVFSIFPFSSKGQDSTEISWAKHLRRAIEKRPNPTMFSEVAAWWILTGEKPESQVFQFKEIEFSRNRFLVKEKTWSESYSRSKTSSKDGWWYTTTKSFDEGRFITNWSLIVAIFFILLFFLISNFNLKKRVWKLDLINSNEDELSYSTFYWNILPALCIAGCEIIIHFAGKITPDPIGIFALLLIFFLSSSISHLRIKRILK